MRAQILDVTEQQYHSDPCPEPSLSASLAKILEQRSPLHAWQSHPRLGGTPREPSDAMSHGTLMHALVLGAGPEIEPIDAADWRTKAARDARDAVRAAGRIPVLAAQLAPAREAAARIVENLAAAGVRLDGASEVSIAWQETAQLLEGPRPVWCRARLDHVRFEAGEILDFKTTENAHPDNAARASVAFGYTIQHAAYVRALEALRPELAGRVRFRFLFAETAPPYAVTVAELDGALREHGARAWTRSVETFAACLTRNDWPGYAGTVATLAAPPWVLSELGT